MYNNMKFGHNVKRSSISLVLQSSNIVATRILALHNSHLLLPAFIYFCNHTKTKWTSTHPGHDIFFVAMGVFEKCMAIIVLCRFGKIEAAM